MKKILTAILLVAVAAFAAGKVKSKSGAIDLMKAQGGTDATCTADFSEELSLIKAEGAYSLVKGSCGQGWVANASIEKVAAAAGDKSMKLEGVDVVGWLDNPSAVFVLDNDGADFDGINIDRDFKEYLTHTLDREKLERNNQEN